MEDSYCSLVEFLCRNYWIRRGNFTQDTKFGLRQCNLPVGEPSFVHASNIHLLFCTKFKLNSSFSALPPLLHSLCFFVPQWGAGQTKIMALIITPTFSTSCFPLMEMSMPFLMACLAFYTFITTENNKLSLSLF